MSQAAAKTDSEDRAPSIERAGKHKWGYNVAQVDEFLDRTHTLYESDTPMLNQEDIQLASFDLEKDGYVISQVDAVLIRLEKAVVDKRTQYALSTTGQDAWQDDLLALARTLQERAEAPEKQRFSRGTHHQPSYDVRQVDQIVAQSWTHIARVIGITTSLQPAEGSQEISAQRVSNVIFTQRKGRHGYSEASVDAYLNRCVQVLTRIESYGRVAGRPLQPFDTADGVAFPSPQARQTVTAAVSPAQSAPASSAAAGTGSARPTISFDGPSPVPRQGDQVPEAFSPIPAPSARPVEQGMAQDTQSQDGGWGSAGLASLVSVPNQDASSPTEEGQADSATSVLSHPASPAVPASAVAPDHAPAGGDHDEADARQDASATTTISPDGIFASQHPAAASFHDNPDKTTAPMPEQPRQDAAVRPGRQEPETAPSQQLSQQIYSDLPAVPAPSADNSKDSAASDASYISSLLNTSVASTGSFEIPDLTFPSAAGRHDTNRSETDDRTDPHAAAESGKDGADHNGDESE